MKALTTVAIALLLAGCATTTPAPPTAKVYSGEVWTWDEPNSIVTLFSNGQIQRVKVSPEQMRTLRLHDQARVTGELAPPADMLVVTGSGPMAPVPRGQAESMEVKGTVATVDPNGRIAINSERGPVHVWAAAGADQRFARGAPVSVKMIVQPVDMRPLAAGQPAPAVAPAASPTSEPGDHAVVTGRILGVNPGGVLVVESPTGPIQVLVSDGNRYKVNDFVQINTTVRAAS